MPEDCGENFVGITRIDRERRDLLAIAQAEMLPGLARIGRFVNAVADGKIGAVQSLAAGGINNVGIGRGNGDGADRLSGFVVEDGGPGAAVVVGLPHAAVYLRHVIDVWLAGNAGDGARAAAAEWANHAPVQFLISILGNLCV